MKSSFYLTSRFYDKTLMTKFIQILGLHNVGIVFGRHETKLNSCDGFWRMRYTMYLLPFI